MEAIEGKRTFGSTGNVQYLVHWSGSASALGTSRSWETEERVRQEAAAQLQASAHHDKPRARTTWPPRVHVGLSCDALDSKGVWAAAKVVAVQSPRERFKVHFVGAPTPKR